MNTKSLSHSLGFIAVLLVLLLIAQLVIVGLQKRFADEMITNEETDHIIDLIGDEFLFTSRDLTICARAYCVSRQEDYLRRYKEVLDWQAGRIPRPMDLDRRILDRLQEEKISQLEMLERLGLTKNECRSFAKAADCSDQLALIELQAMESIRAGHIVEGPVPPEQHETPDAFAIRVLYGTRYQAELDRIASYVMTFFHEHEEVVQRRIVQSQNKFHRTVIASFGAQIMIFLVLGAGAVYFLRIQANSSERIRIMLDATPLACNFWDEHCRNIDCNLEAAKLFGLKDKKEYIDRFMQLSPEFQPDGRRSSEKGIDKVRAAFKTGMQQFEWLHQKLDGTPVPAEITLVRVERGSGHIVVGYTRDLREFKKMLADIREADERTRIMLDTTPLCCNLWDEEFRTIDCNLEAVKLYGMKDKQEYIDRFSELSPEYQPCGRPSKEMSREHLVKAFTEGRHEFEWMHRRPDGEPMPAEITLVRVKQGDRFIVAGYTRDLREIKKGEEERKRYAENLEKAKNEAEEANKAKSEFLATMSHEIRTPLNGVLGLSELLLKTKQNEKQHEYTELINASGQSLLFLINDILDFSKIEAGKLEIDSEPFDLPATVESVLGILASRAVDKGLELGIAFRHGMPRIVKGDSGRLRQILLNLGGNAIKFTDHGGVRIEISIDSIDETSIVIRFQVIDTGIGIPEDRINRLFKAFSQADASSARVYGGTGLGLAISMRLVHLMGGRIGVESTEGKGSVFWFTVAFGCNQVVFDGLRHEEKNCFLPGCSHGKGYVGDAVDHHGLGEVYNLEGKTILIADDNEIHRETLQIQLTSWKIQCTTCASGKEALERFEEADRQGRSFDLVLLDNTLADGTGFELAARLFEQKTLYGRLMPPLILLRPLTVEYDMDFVRKIGAEVIGKPVFVSVLFDAVMNLLFTHDTHPKTRWHEKPTVQTKRPVVSIANELRLLVVEDNRVNQIVVKNLLLEAGLRCDIANNGREACDAVRNGTYDLILMDCQMPEMDGYEATDLIRQWEREQGKKRIPIIALTANATRDDVQKCFEAGMDAYCSKPINPDILFETIMKQMVVEQVGLQDVVYAVDQPIE